MSGINFGRRARGSEGAQPAWVSALPDGVWAQVGANTLQDVDPRYDSGVNPNHPNRPPWAYNATTVTNFADASALFTSWGGLAYDATNKRGMFCGGGHNDYAGNEVYGLELARSSPTFYRYSNPYTAGGSNGALDDGQEATNQYATGQPRSIHSYGSLQADSQYLYMSSCPAPFQTATSTYGCFWRYNVSTGAWSRLLQETSSGNAGKFYACAVTCFDSTRGRIYGWANNAVYPSYYNVSAGTFHTDTSFQPNIDGTESWLLYIPELDVQLCLNRLYTGFVGVADYGATGGGFVNQPGVTGNAPGVSPTYSTLGYSARMYPNGVWVPGYGGGVGAVLCWHGGRDIYVLTPPSSSPAVNAWAWSKRTISTGDDPGSVNANGVFGRFFYDPTYKTLGLLKDYNAAPYWLKMPATWFQA